MKLNLRENAFDYLSCLMVLILPFSAAIPNLILIVLSLLFLKGIFVDKKYTIQWQPLVLLISLFLYLTSKALILGSYTADNKIYNGYLLVILLFLVLQHVSDIQRLKLAIVLMATLMSVCSFVLIGNYYIHTHILPFSNGMETNSLLFFERPYAGITAIFGFFLSLSFAKVYQKYKWWFVVNAAIMVLFIVIVSARLSLLTVFFLGMVYLLFYSRINIYKKIGFIVVLFGIIAGLLVFNKNISNRFFISKNFEKSLEAAADLEPRVVIWDCAYHMRQESNFNNFFGFESYSSITKRYQACYASKIEKKEKRDYFLEENFNSHNQLIDFYLIGGLTALLLFISFLVNAFRMVRNNFTATALFVAFVLFFILENVFYRQYGCFLFALFLVMYLRKKNNQATENL